jgi:hypothetical protein
MNENELDPEDTKLLEWMRRQMDVKRVLVLAENSDSTDALVLSWEIRSLRKKVAELEEGVEYEYAVTSVNTDNGAPYISDWYGNIESAAAYRQEAVDVCNGADGRTMPYKEFKIVKRRKAGKVEDA